MAADVSEPIEIHNGGYILRLEGNVIEVFVRDASMSRRWHVCHVSIDAKPDRKGEHMKYVLGTRRQDIMTNGIEFKVAMSHRDTVDALIAEAVRRRDLSAATTIATPD